MNDKNNYSLVSRVVTKNNRAYVEKDGRPKTLHSLHIRPDLIYQHYGLKTKEDYDRVLKPYYREAAKLGFKTVNCQIHWREIEFEKDHYDFSFWDNIYSYLNEYDLNVMLLWCGTDNCGFYSDNVPAYIRETPEDYYLYEYTYPDGTTDKKVLDYSNPKLIEREKKVIAKLMEHLYEFDINHRTLAVQIMNEANCSGHGLKTPMITVTTPPEEVERIHWVGGQEKALMSFMNELGLVVKNSQYRCITRMNFISFHCYNNGASDAPKRVAALPGIDIVGMDCFDIGKTMDEYFMTKVANYPGNVPHIPESVSGPYTIFAKMLCAFKLGGTIFPYELRSIGDYETLSLLRRGEGEFEYRDGTKFLKNTKTLESSTYDWISFNKMVNSIEEMLVTTNIKDIAVFNTTTQMSDVQEKRRVGDYDITFRSTTDKPYGTVGLAMRAADGSYLFYTLNETTEFIIEDAEINDYVSVGYYDKDKWVETGIQAYFENKFVVSKTSASKGKVFRLTEDKITRR